MTARAGCAVLLLFPLAAGAHSFGRVYNLPVPFWMYAWGATAALVASFLVVGYFVPARPAPAAAPSPARSVTLGSRGVLVLKVLAVAGLLLCIVSGFAGTKSPYGNFNMTFFWIVFALGFTYLTAVIGDAFAAINPWRVIGDAIGRLVRTYTAGRVRYPERLAYWPALLFYMAFIWLELFGRTGPFSLSVILAAYTAINLAGIGLIGSRDWFRYCEFFSVFFRLVARMAPVEWRASESGRARLQLRVPFTGLIDPPAESLSLLLFVLFMLSSTAFDGLHETLPWMRLFWVDLYGAVLRDWVGHNPLAAFPAMSRILLAWQSFWLLASPFIYLAAYLAFVWLARLATGRTHTLRQLALEFALPLLPIALVYNVTHYYTLVQTQGLKIFGLLSDPLGRGWNLFGTVRWFRGTIIPEPGTVWHVQVALIVAGHIVGVYIAHRVALRLFPTPRQALASQLPMLVLMVLFTTVGLWILSQPTAVG